MASFGSDLSIDTLPSVPRIVDVTLGSNVNDWVIPGLDINTDIVRVNATAIVAVTGVVMPASINGRRKRLIWMNVATNVLFAMTFMHESSSSAAANRIYGAGANNIAIPAFGGMGSMYDDAAQRTRIYAKGL